MTNERQARCKVCKKEFIYNCNNRMTSKKYFDMFESPEARRRFWIIANSEGIWYFVCDNCLNSKVDEIAKLPVELGECCGCADQTPDCDCVHNTRPILFIHENNKG